MVLSAIGAGYYFYSDIGDIYQQVSTHFQKEVKQLKTINKKVVAPPPLRGPTKEVETELTASGTIKATNEERTQRGLSALSTNDKLTRAAQRKVDDMFEKQYFAHESPTGKGAGDLAKNAGYEYTLVGENLALGNYEGDKALVEAWMNSPGHRENILTKKYTEIGVAVGRGTYEGREVWLAVQEFGKPMPSCENPNEELNAEINENQTLLKELKEKLDAKRDRINNMRSKRRTQYNKLVEQYNELRDRYNALAKKTEELISKYNNQVNNYNECMEE